MLDSAPFCSLLNLMARHGLMGSMFERGLTFALCLSLAALVPVPISACAALRDLPAQCQPQPDCQQMGMAQPTTSVEASSNSSCCRLREAPVPQLPSKVSVPDAAAHVASVQHSLADDLKPQEQSAPTALETPSPPDRRSLLCVFLI